MAKELVISSNRHETKVAVLEDEQLVEIHFQRANEYSLAGSIHKGRVTRVLPGMQSAFVDIGLERDAFLYVSDFVEETEEYDRIPVRAVERPAPEPEPAETPERRERRLRRGRRRRARSHGLPESKYATAESPSESAGLGEFAILPGESLAKYRDLIAEAEKASAPQTAPTEALAGQQAAEPISAPETHDVVAPLEDSLAQPEAAPPETPAQSAEEEELRTVEEAAAALSRPESHAATVQPAGPDISDSEIFGAHDAARPAALEAPAEEPVPAHAAPPIEETQEALEETAEEALEEAAEEAVEEVAEEAEDELETEESHAQPADLEFESAETESAEAVEETVAGEEWSAEVPETAEHEEEGETVAAEEAAETGAESALAEDEGFEPARRPVSLTATLREQGLRYLHRPSRRLRRRMRREEAERAQRTETEARHEAAERPQPSITELLHEGQEVLVQIAKEPLGQKGARITSHITLPGRYVVYMPTVDHLGVSRKISSPEERLRLKKILQRNRGNMPGGFIVRTVGEGRSEEEIAADMRFLYNLWLDIRRKADKAKAPALIYHDLDLVSRVLRDELTEDFKAIWTDNEEVYERVVGFVQRFQPSLVPRVKLYTRPEPIFDAFNISQELEKALRPRVWLKSGGYIVINQTEALVAIDVNTGKFVGKSNRLEDTIFRTNTEAVKEIVRQIRLRDLGGIIVIDFIDMEDRKNRQRLMQALEEAMRVDRAPYKILQFNDFGLVAITRKRVKQSLERALCSPCPYCEGSGYVKSVQTVIGEILQEAQRIRGAVEGRQVMLRVNPEVAKVLKSSDNNYLEELEEILGRPVIVTSDPTMQQDKFDLL